MKQDKAIESPQKLLLEEFFEGSISGSGLFEDRFGNVRREFTIDANGWLEGKRLVLKEDFTYSDGERETRVWHFDKNDRDVYVGTADGVVGHATGEAIENTLRWEYEFDLPVGDSTWRVSFDDRMILLDNQVVISRAHVTRWGIRLGTVTISFRKAEPKRARKSTRNVSRPQFGERAVAAAG